MTFLCTNMPQFSTTMTLHGAVQQHPLGGAAVPQLGVATSSHTAVRSTDCPLVTPTRGRVRRESGTCRARPHRVPPAVDDRPGNRYQRDPIEVHSHSAVREAHGFVEVNLLRQRPSVSHHERFDEPARAEANQSHPVHVMCRPVRATSANVPR